MFCLIFSVSLPSPNPYIPLGELSFLWALSPKQLLYNYHLPTSPLDSIPFHLSLPPHSWPTGSVNFNISSLTLLLFPFLSAPSPVLVILPVSQLPKPAKVYKTIPPSKSYNGTLKSTQDWISSHTGMQAQNKSNNPDSTATKSLVPHGECFLRELSHKALQFLPRTTKASVQRLLAWFAMARGTCLTR